MGSKHKTLLVIDAIINLVLGVLLLFFPLGVVELFGLPFTNTNFYPSILGAIIVGIGMALFIELVGFNKKIRGLGLGGAIIINIIGSFVLISWLSFGSLTMPLKGQITLWIIGILVFSIGIAELVMKSWSYAE